LGAPESAVLVVDTDVPAELSAIEIDRVANRLRSAQFLTVAVTGRGDVLAPIASATDISLAYRADGHGHGHRATVACVDPVDEVAQLIASVASVPRAALALTWLLRYSIELEVPAALSAESGIYSMLLGSAEFGLWIAGRGPARPPGPPERVEVRRDADNLTICLSRPGRRNAVDARMRDALTDALELAEADPALRVTLVGAGLSFSAGGDLDEFGSAHDPGAAHLIRVVASPGAVVARIRDRVRAYVHGACIGAGVEIPCFAGWVAAAPDTLFALPEIGMGLIPGAGGTVSIPRRIGRSRALWMAITGRRVDVRTALAWGLIDAIEDRPVIR
jgi:hypothetical protein